MVNYKCDRCHKLFKTKQNYDKHIDRKFKCPIIPPIPSVVPPIPSEVQHIKKEYKCTHCLSIFARSDGLKRHMGGRCKVKNNKEENDQNRRRKYVIKNEISNRHSK